MAGVQTYMVTFVTLVSLTSFPNSVWERNYPGKLIGEAGKTALYYKALDFNQGMGLTSLAGWNLLPICAQVGILAKLALEKRIELI